jgi:hypothetical protein
VITEIALLIRANSDLLEAAQNACSSTRNAEDFE